MQGYFYFDVTLLILGYFSTGTVKNQKIFPLTMETFML